MRHEVVFTFIACRHDHFKPPFASVATLKRVSPVSGRIAGAGQGKRHGRPGHRLLIGSRTSPVILTPGSSVIVTGTILAVGRSPPGRNCAASRVRHAARQDLPATPLSRRLLRPPACVIVRVHRKAEWAWEHVGNRHHAVVVRPSSMPLCCQCQSLTPATGLPVRLSTASLETSRPAQAKYRAAWLHRSRTVFFSRATPTSGTRI